jgi:hypothetical protein
MTQPAETSPSMMRWLLERPSWRPIAVARWLCGLWLCGHFVALALDWPLLLQPPHTEGSPFLGAELVRHADVFRLAFVREHASAWLMLAGVLGLVAAAGHRSALAIVLPVAVSVGRHLHPLGSPGDDAAVLLGHALLLLPARPALADAAPARLAAGTRAGVLGLGVLAICWWWPWPEPLDLLEAAGPWLTVMLLVACLLALFPRAPQPRAAGILDTSTLLAPGCVALVLAPSLAAGIGATSLSPALHELRADLGLTPVRGDLTALHSLHVQSRGQPQAAGVQREPWPRLARAPRTWAWLAAQAAAEHTDVALARSRAALAESLAEQACRAAAPAGITDVAALRGEERIGLFSFRCAGRRARLVPRPASVGLLDDLGSLGQSVDPSPAAIARRQSFERDLSRGFPSEAAQRQYLLDLGATASRPPVLELVRLAQLRYAARELDESIRLMHQALRNASPQLRASANLDVLYAALVDAAHGSKL